MAMMNNLDPPLEEQRRGFDVLSVSDPEQIRSLLDLLTAKLGRLTGNRVSWTENNPVSANYADSMAPQMMSYYNSHIIQRDDSSNKPLTILPSRDPPVIQWQLNRKPQGTPSGIEMNVSQPVPRKIQNQHQPALQVDQQPPKKVENHQENDEKLSPDEVKSLSLNPVRKQAKKLDHPGVQPERKHLKVSNIIGNNRYYLISKVAILGSNKPLEPVFQSEETGLFYNNLGRCLKTDNQGRIFVYKTKKGQYRYGLWAQPKPKSNDIDTLIQESRDDLAIHEAQYGYQTILNPDYKSGKVKKPRLLTITSTGATVSRKDDPAYFQKIEEMAFLCRLRKRNSKIKSKQDSDLVIVDNDEKHADDMHYNSDMDISEGEDNFGADSENGFSRSDFNPEAEHVMG